MPIRKKPSLILQEDEPWSTSAQEYGIFLWPDPLNVDPSTRFDVLCPPKHGQPKIRNQPRVPRWRLERCSNELDLLPDDQWEPISKTIGSHGGRGRVSPSQVQLPPLQVAKLAPDPAVVPTPPHWSPYKAKPVVGLLPPLTLSPQSSPIAANQAFDQYTQQPPPIDNANFQVQFGDMAGQFKSGPLGPPRYFEDDIGYPGHYQFDCGPAPFQPQWIEPSYQ